MKQIACTMLVAVVALIGLFYFVDGFTTVSQRDNYVYVISVQFTGVSGTTLAGDNIITFYGTENVSSLPTGLAIQNYIANYVYDYSSIQVVNDGGAVYPFGRFSFMGGNTIQVNDGYNFYLYELIEIVHSFNIKAVLL